MYFSSAYRASSILFQITVSNKGYWIIPDNVCHVVMATLVLADCTPLVLDVDKQTLELNHYDVLQIIKQNKLVTGIVMVRAFGNGKSDYSEFIRNIRKIDSKILFVDDRCLCEPTLQIVDCDADYYLFSTGYSKFVDLGYGGYCYSKSKIIPCALPYSEEHEIEFNNFFSEAVNSQSVISQKYIYKISKLNWLNLKSLDASYIDLVQKNYEAAYEHKKLINNIYSNIKKDFVLGNDFNSWRFNLLLENRDEILKLFIENGIFSSKHYFSISKLLGQVQNKTWNFYSKHIINLFNDRRCSVTMASKSVEIINKYGRSIK
jgi:hypothetical protein